MGAGMTDIGKPAAKLPSKAEMRITDPAKLLLSMPLSTPASLQEILICPVMIVKLQILVPVEFFGYLSWAFYSA